MSFIISSVSHTFPSRPPRPALQRVSFEAPAGQFVALIGPSGCGKSTLLRMAANLIQPAEGQIWVDGLTPAQAVARQQVAWLSQSPALLPWLTAEKNVALAGRFRDAPVLAPLEALNRVGLGDARHAYPHMLSGGMQQRLALARTLTQNASLWLMDEPFAALDELTRERLTGELLEMWQAFRPTVLWVTHHIYEALRMADRVLVMSGAPGEVIADFEVNLPRPRDETRAAYLSLLQQVRAALSGSATGRQLDVRQALRV